jgi:hypothetical protein
LDFLSINQATQQCFPTTIHCLPVSLLILLPQQALYAAAFDWIVSRINAKLDTGE